MRPLPYALTLGALGLALALWPDGAGSPPAQGPASEPARAGALEAWAGTYLAERGCGPDHGLVLGPDGRFRDVGACAVRGDHRGRATLLGGLLRLRVVDPPSDVPGGRPLAGGDTACACASREDRWLVPVRWDARRYLVPKDAMDAFCDDVNAGIEPRGDPYGRVWMRRGDERADAFGAPDVPAAWRVRLLARPVLGRVLALDGPRHALVDTGRRHGLVAGQRVFLADAVVVPGGGEAGEDLCRHVPAEVVAVEDDWARVWIPGGEAAAAPGQRVSTRRPRRLARGQREDTIVRIEPVPPLPGTSRARLARWTEWVRAAYLRPVPAGELEEVLGRLEALDPVDATPAYLNAIGTVDSADARVRERLDRLYAEWHARQGGHALWVEPPRVTPADRGEGESTRPRLLGGLTLQALRTRVALLADWAESWRELACRPEYLAEYREELGRG